MKLHQLTLLAIAFISLFSCNSGDEKIDELFENTERGAILRTVQIIENSIPIAIENGQTTTPDNAGLAVILEEQDVKDGDLLESIDVFVSFKDNSEIGDSSGAVTDEIFLKNIPASAFTRGEFGLPRVDLEVSVDEMMSVLNLTTNAIFGGDTFTTRVALKLTEGRTFSATDANGNIASGSFYNSPFQYVTPVVCELPETSFVGDYLIEEITPLVDGPTLADGTVVTVEIGDTPTERFFNTTNYPDYCSSLNAFKFQFVCGEIVVPLQNSVCACNSGADFFGPSTTPANYDAADDTVFLITFSNDVQTDCAAPVDTTYRLTKQ